MLPPVLSRLRIPVVASPMFIVSGPEPVSYTHLDVYKRQGQRCWRLPFEQLLAVEASHQKRWNGNENRN